MGYHTTTASQPASQPQQLYRSRSPKPRHAPGSKISLASGRFATHAHLMIDSTVLYGCGHCQPTAGIWLSVAPHKVRISKSMYPVRGEGCIPSALLFRRVRACAPPASPTRERHINRPKQPSWTYLATSSMKKTVRFYLAKAEALHTLPVIATT